MTITITIIQGILVMIGAWFAILAIGLTITLLGRNLFILIRDQSRFR